MTGQIIVSLQCNTKVDVIPKATRSNSADLSRAMALSDLSLGEILWLQSRGWVGRVWGRNWTNRIRDYPVSRRKSLRA